MSLEGRTAVVAGGAGGLGVFSVVVSATGVVIPSRPLVSRGGAVLSLETLRANMELHVYGPFNLARHAAAKGAVVSMVLPMARDLAPHGIRVCAVAPGAFATPRLASPEVRELLVRDVLFPKRVGLPEEFAALVEGIVTNPYLNGEVIRLDGGARLSPRMG